MKRKFNACFLILLWLALINTAPQYSAAQSKVKRYEPSKTSEAVPGQPYEKFSTRDRFNREIIFYLSTTRAKARFR